MNPAGFTVRRPVLTVMAALIAVTLGLMALLRLPIDLMPELTYPALTVTTAYENAGPEEIETLITRPVEQAVSAVPGLEEMSSVSAEGMSQVRLAFTWGTDIDAAAIDVRDRLDRILDTLPEEAERSTVRKYDTAAAPVMILGMTSGLDPLAMRRLAEDRVRQRLERVPGVAAVDVWGGLEREIQVRVNPVRLRAVGLSLEQVRDALRGANVSIPAGEVRRGRLDIRIRTPGEFQRLDEIRRTVLTVANGAPVRLEQVAEVVDTHARIEQIIRVNSAPAIRLAVRKQADANTVEVVEGARRELARLRLDYPQFGFVNIIDNAGYIERAIDNVTRTLGYGSLLAVLVLFVFLRRVRPTLVAATAIPISVISTFALIHFSGYTLNLMTMGGLALGVGMMVDNAIVVIENISRRRELGDAGGVAAVTGTGEVAAAVVASTLTTMAIFLPMFFTEGLAGVLFRQLAAVVAFALFASLLVALTLVPMLMGRAGRTDPAGIAAPDGGLTRTYEATLARALRHPWWTVAIAAVLLAGSAVLVPRVGTEFMPETDDGRVRLIFEMAPGTRLHLLDEQVRRAEAAIEARVPERLAWASRAGTSSFRASSPATAGMFLTLVPRSERERDVETVAADLREAVADFPGVDARVRAARALYLPLGSGEEESLLVEIRGFELGVLAALASAVEERLETVAGITDARVSREEGAPQRLVRIDRDRAADLGVSVERIARTLETALGGTAAGVYREDGDEHRILVQVRESRELSPEDVLRLTVPADDGTPVALASLVRLVSGTGPIQIERKEQQRVVNVAANISGRDLGSVAADARAALATIPLPRDVAIELAGDYESQSEAFGELGISFLLAVVLVYMILASLYESLRDPLIVMMAIPFAGIGVVAMLLATGTTFNVQSIIGCIMLVGIAVNNAILLVDQAATLRREEGRPVEEAVAEAGRRRLRPILMTTGTTILALVPLALGTGEGGEAQAPMARAVIGGLLSSSVIVLFLVPAMYRLVHPERRISEA